MNRPLGWMTLTSNRTIFCWPGLPVSRLLAILIGAMKTWLIAFSAFLLVGCESPHSPITATQAGALSAQLANDKADPFYHRRPFQNDLPAQFKDGRWIWTGGHGAGMLDFQARVELAADGSTNSVDVTILDSNNPL